jgi:recombination protein RecT
LAARVEATQVARQTGSGKTVFQALEDPKFKTQLARALPKAINPERFLRLVLTECRTSPNLMRCSHASLLGATMTAAQLGLEIDVRGLAYLIPRRHKNGYAATLMIGYRGYVELARRSGDVRDVRAHVVYERDDFDCEYGDSPRLFHRPTLIGERGEPVAAYAVAFYKDGTTSALALRVDEIEARRKRSAARDDGPWVTDWDAMARKTAVRALAPYLPQTPEFAHALALDEQVRVDYEKPLEDVKPLEDDGIPEAELVGDAEDGEAPGGSDPPFRPDQRSDEVAQNPQPSAADPPGLSEYDALTPAQLRAECARRELDPKGSKADLVARLVAFDERPFVEDVT